MGTHKALEKTADEDCKKNSASVVLHSLGLEFLYTQLSVENPCRRHYELDGLISKT